MVVFLIYNLKTRAIVSYYTKQLKEDELMQKVKLKNSYYKVGLNSHEVLDLYRASVEAYEPPYAIHSDNNPSYFSFSFSFSKEIENFCKEYDIKFHHHVKQAILQHNQKPMNKKKNSLIKQEAQNATASDIISSVYKK